MSREQAPLFLLPGATHCLDLVVRNGIVNAGVEAVQKSAVAIMKDWVERFYLKPPRGGPKE